MTLGAEKTDVRFDFTGALDLARQLWALADLVEATMKSRSPLATAAQAHFAGAYADQFAQRISVEAANGATIARDLRDAASECAQAWRKATNEENRRSYARQVQRLRADENLFQQALYHFTGNPFPPEPASVPLPQPPAFSPAGTHICSG